MLKQIERHIEEFIGLIAGGQVEVYNEFSFQHELGIYLRTHIDNNRYKIQFERNVAFFRIDKARTIKKEIDIVIYDNDKFEKYAIELKYPMNGQYPESMYSFIKDIKFCEQLSEYGFDGTISLTLVDDRLFYNGASNGGIYRYFRGGYPVTGTIDKPTGNDGESLKIDGSYSVKWKDVNDTSKYFAVIIPKNHNGIQYNLEPEPLKYKPLQHSIKTEVSKRVPTQNMGIEGIKQYIRGKIEEARENNQRTVTLISGQISKELGLKNAMPSVCSAMRSIAKECPDYEIKKPETVKGENSSTISVTYKW